ncbi:MAG: hypothetical protein IT204_04015 [Fimbriimonadaceae bacterium]|nr:hypothetical protein [Fimbriimonadaceae bacterium]
MRRQAVWWGTVLSLATFGLAGCSGGGSTTGGGLVVDTTYNFTTAGVLPGVDTRSAGRGKLAGRLLNSSLVGVSGVTVTLYRLTENRSRQIGSTTTVSNTSGDYVFGNVEPGQYRLSCQGQSADATAVANSDTTANFSNVVGGGGGGGGGDAEFKWTLIMFMNADNDLEEYAIEDINEMEALANHDDVAIVVMLDRTRGFDTSNGNWTDTRRFRVRHDSDPTVMTSALSAGEGGQAEVLGEVDTGDKDVLKAFVQYAMAEYPAERYLVNIWNHGAGWRHRAAGGTRGVLFDDTQNTFVTTPELSDALNVGTNLDIVSFDSSLMQMMEVAYQIRGLCSFVVGSEESPPGEGYPYTDILAPLISNPDTAAETLAAHIVNETVDVMGGSFELTQSALRSAQLGALQTAISNYADLLRAKDGTFHSQIVAARAAAQRYGSGSSLYEGNRDLLDFCDEVASRTNDAQLIAGREAVRAALTAALVAERHSGSSKADSTGVAIFNPSQTDWQDLRTRYRQQSFATDGRWDEWLDDFYNIGG